MAVYCRAKAGIALLSLDGGGVKGISSLLILKRIMEKVAVHENRELEKERLPKDYFDLAGGTSTGGLATLMLFRLGMNTSQAIKQYENLAAKVFAPTIGNILCEALGETVLFRSYKRPDDVEPQSETAKLIKHKNITIMQACRATSAAPTYLPEMTIDKIKYWDGGLLNNNPVDQVWDARYDLPQARLIGHNEQTIHIEPPVAYRWWRFVKIVFRALDYATNTEAKHWDFKGNNLRRNRRLDKDQRTEYYRFNADASKDINLDDFKQMGVLVEDTKKYITKLEEATEKELDACAEVLAKPILV